MFQFSEQKKAKNGGAVLLKANSANLTDSGKNFVNSSLSVCLLSEKVENSIGPFRVFTLVNLHIVKA